VRWLWVERTAKPCRRILIIRSALTNVEVQQRVSRFWKALTEKRYQEIRDFYSAEALVFGSNTERAEAALVAASRRSIEYFGDQMSLQIDLGPVAVQLVGEQMAVASYTFSFSATETHSAGSQRDYERIRHGRATQVFAVQKDNVARIVHEHLSVPYKR